MTLILISIHLLSVLRCVMWLAVSVHHTLLHSIFYFFFFVLHNDAGRSLATGHVLTQFLVFERL